MILRGKITSFPLILFGTDFWTPMLDWITSTVLADGKISPPDVHLFTVTDDVDHAVAIIQAAEREKFGS
jgi:predicted Rossmann-fold nucleotide-binding protein